MPWYLILAIALAIVFLVCIRDIIRELAIPLVLWVLGLAAAIGVIYEEQQLLGQPTLATLSLMALTATMIHGWWQRLVNFVASRIPKRAKVQLATTYGRPLTHEEIEEFLKRP